MGDGIPGHERLPRGIGALQPFEELPRVAASRVDECNLEWKIGAAFRDQFVESRVSRGLIASGMLRQRHIEFAPDSLRLQLRFAQRDLRLPAKQSKQREIRMNELGAWLQLHRLSKSRFGVVVLASLDERRGKIGVPSNPERIGIDYLSLEGDV